MGGGGRVGVEGGWYLVHTFPASLLHKHASEVAGATSRLFATWKSLWEVKVHSGSIECLAGNLRKQMDFQLHLAAD